MAGNDKDKSQVLLGLRTDNLFCSHHYHLVLSITEDTNEVYSPISTVYQTAAGTGKYHKAVVKSERKA